MKKKNEEMEKDRRMEKENEGLEEEEYNKLKTWSWFAYING